MQFCWQYINAYQLVLVMCTCGKQSRRFKLLPLRAIVCRVNTVYNFKGCARVLQRGFAGGGGGVPCAQRGRRGSSGKGMSGGHDLR